LLPPLAHVAGKAVRANLVQVQPFATTFGKQATRKRPKLGADNYAEMLQHVSVKRLNTKMCWALP
jgi:hypothetical protein